MNGMKVYGPFITVDYFILYKHVYLPKKYTQICMSVTEESNQDKCHQKHNLERRYSDVIFTRQETKLDDEHKYYINIKTHPLEEYYV